MRIVDSITTAKDLDNQIGGRVTTTRDQFEALRDIGLMQLARLEAIHEGIYELVNKPPEKYVPDLIKLSDSRSVVRTSVTGVLKSTHEDQYFVVVTGDNNLSEITEFDNEEAREERYDALLREWKGETESE